MTPPTLFDRPPAPPALTDRLESGIMPLINLVFLLLMFFLVTGVILEEQLPELPANEAVHDRQEPRVDFTIAADGRLMQRGKAVDLARLGDILEAPGPQPDGGSTLYRLGADENLTMAALERVLAAFNRAGVAQVQLLTEPAQ